MNISKEYFITAGLSIYAIYVSYVNYSLTKQNENMQELKSDIYEILKKSEDSDNKMKNEFRILRQELHKLQVDTNIILQLHKCNEDNDEILEYESNDYDDTDLLQMEINMPETVCDVSRSRSHSLSSLKGVVKTFFG